jgi:hypothetical protein
MRQRKELIVKTKLSFLTLVFLSLFSISNFTHAALINRGGGMIYDDVLDVTWLQEAVHLTNHYGSALDYVDSLVHGGYDDWRLPRVLVSDGSDGMGNILNVTESEVSHLLILTLGNIVNPGAPLGTPAVELNSCSPFLGLTVDGCGGEHYDHPWWLDASAYGPEVTYWAFNVWAGEHTHHHSAHSGLVWAVRDGDVTVPEPSTILLMATGIAGFLFVGRKRQRV